MNPLSQFGDIGGGINSEMNQAWSDLGSTNPQDQLKGQFLMQEAMQQYTACSTALKDLSDMSQTAINNSKDH